MQQLLEKAIKLGGNDLEYTTKWKDVLKDPLQKLIDGHAEAAVSLGVPYYSGKFVPRLIAELKKVVTGDFDYILQHGVIILKPVVK